MDENDRDAMKIDVAIIGAGIGGLYALKRMRDDGLSALAIEAAPDVGGVWYHNRYPGARVDIESQDYCYWFSPELYREWKWSERYATQGELLSYLRHVADRFDLRKDLRLGNRVVSAVRRDGRWNVETDKGLRFAARFLVMATGNLSEPRKPDFQGIDRFRGEWVQTSIWPDREVRIAGRRVAVIGTGSSGIQVIPEVARTAAHLTVFQRTPNFTVPAHNGEPDIDLRAEITADVGAARQKLLSNSIGAHFRLGQRMLAEYEGDELQDELERKWMVGGQGMNAVLSDQTTNAEANAVVAEFVRRKIRETVKDPYTAERLCPWDHPIGTRRLCVDSDYYATFNRPNVTLVDARDEAIEEITETGIRTTKAHHDFDLIIFALGFIAFTGAIDQAGIRNEAGLSPTSAWGRGPQTWLGLMTAGFPNFFMLTGPGSQSILANMFVGNEVHVDFVADLIGYMDRHEYAEAEPRLEAVESWTSHVTELGKRLLRNQVKNYMVHVNEDGTRAFIPYSGGLHNYIAEAKKEAENGFPGLTFKVEKQEGRSSKLQINPA